MKSKMLCIMASILILALGSYAFGAQDFILLPARPGEVSDAIPLHKAAPPISTKATLPTVDMELSHDLDDLENCSILVGLETADTLGVLFASPAACTLLEVYIITWPYYAPAAEAYFDGFVADVPAGVWIDDYNEYHGSGGPGPTPIESFIAGPTRFVSDTFAFRTWDWDTLKAINVDVGTDAFYAGWALVGSPGTDYDSTPNPAIDASIAQPWYCIRWVPDPGSGVAGWYSSYHHAYVRALVRMYSNPPPVIVDYTSLPYTYSSDARDVTIECTDFGIPVDSSGIGEVNLYYSVDCAPWTAVSCSLVSGDMTDGVFAAAIPGAGLFSNVDYYFEVIDLQGNFATSLVNSYKILQGSNWGILYIVDPGAYLGYGGGDPVAVGAKDFVDHWYTGTYGIPPKEVFDFYMPGGKAPHGQDIMAYSGWGGDGIAGAEADVIDFLDAGGNLFISDEDFLYGWAHTYDPYTFSAGEFPYDYLKVSGCFDDFNHDRIATLYGVPGDTISDGFETGLMVSPYCWAGNYTWLGNVDLLDGIGCFYFETGEVCAYHYEDATKGYKIVFLYFTIDYTVSDTCTYDTDASGTIADRAMTWLDIKFPGVGVEEPKVGSIYFLSQNMPNPVSTKANISFSVPMAADVSLKVYDATGRVVSTLVNGKVDAGNHTVTWDAKDVASGVYFYRLNTNEFTQTRKMVVMH